MFFLEVEFSIEIKIHKKMPLQLSILKNKNTLCSILQYFKIRENRIRSFGVWSDELVI